MTSCDFIKNIFNSSDNQKTNTKADTQTNTLDKTLSNNQQAEGTKMEYKKTQIEFLNTNKNKKGVQTTSSGLQYKVITQGAGTQPRAQSTVEVHYQGTLIDGTEFDSSYKRNQTIEFPLNQVIAGWTEGLQLMKEGSTYELYIPSELAYGDQDMRSIPGGSTLIFKVELIKVL